MNYYVIIVDDLSVFFISKLKQYLYLSSFFLVGSIPILVSSNEIRYWL